MTSLCMTLKVNLLATRLIKEVLSKKTKWKSKKKKKEKQNQNKNSYK